MDRLGESCLKTVTKELYQENYFIEYRKKWKEELIQKIKHQVKPKLTENADITVNMP